VQIRAIGIIAGLLIFVSMVQAEETSFVPPNTPNGACIADYFTAFNGGEEAMKAFFLKCFSEQSLKTRSMDERLNIYREMRQQLEQLRPERLVEADSVSATVLASAGPDTWLAYTFRFDSLPPYKMLAIRIEESDPSLLNQPQTPMSEQEFLDSLGNRLETMARQDEFSGVVIIARDNVPVFQKAYGAADKAFDVPNRLDTKFNLGSINKLFTRIAIGQLIQQGKVKFDDTLGQFLPQYPDDVARSRVTVAHLVSMSGGIGDFFGENFDNTPKDRFRANNDFLPMFDSLPLAFEPGTKREYSNGGYVLLGTIVEKASGRNYYDYVRQNIFEPAGMTSTDSYEADIPTPNLAEGYTRSEGDKTARWRSNMYTRPARGSSAGGGYSTAEDLLRFVAALQNHKLLTPAFTQWILTDARPDASKPMAAGEPTPVTQGIIGVAGGAPGINAVLEVDFSTGYAIVVMGNYDPPNAMRVAQMVRTWLKRVTKT